MNPSLAMLETDPEMTRKVVSTLTEQRPAMLKADLETTWEPVSA